MCYHINFLFYVSYNSFLVSSAYIFFLRRIYKKSGTRGNVISTPMRYTKLIVRYSHHRVYRFCPIIIHTSLREGATIFTLLIRNISGISTDFNRSRRQLIKSINNIALRNTISGGCLLSYTIKNFLLYPDFRHI